MYEELEAIAFKHYTDEELKEKFDRAKQQAKEGKCIEVNSQVLDEIFARHEVHC